MCCEPGPWYLCLVLKCVHVRHHRRAGVIDLAPAALAEEVLPEKPGFFRKIVKEPVGVVLTIAPWNYPLLTTVNSVSTSCSMGVALVRGGMAHGSLVQSPQSLPATQ